MRHIKGGRSGWAPPVLQINSSMGNCVPPRKPVQDIHEVGGSWISQTSLSISIISKLEEGSSIPLEDPLPEICKLVGELALLSPCV